MISQLSSIPFGPLSRLSDYYTREFLTTSSPSDIRYVWVLLWYRRSFINLTVLFASWIGSLQLFLMYAPGVLVGRAFDGGYLYAGCLGCVSKLTIP